MDEKEQLKFYKYLYESNQSITEMLERGEE